MFKHVQDLKNLAFDCWKEKSIETGRDARGSLYFLNLRVSPNGAAKVLQRPLRLGLSDFLVSVCQVLLRSPFLMFCMLADVD